MKKMFLMAAILFSVAAMAQNAVMSFNETTHDFGKINEADGRVTTVFEVTNKGTMPLIISNVKASCGCTTPQWTKEPIEPGQTGKITVTYNPNGRPGRFQKSITITSNASDEPTRIYIKGEVIPKPAQPANNYALKVGEMSLEKNFVNLGAVTKGAQKTIEIEYANNTNAAITIDLKFEVDKEAYWKPFISATKLQPGQKGLFEIKLISGACPIYGPIETKMSFVVNGKEYNDDKSVVVIKADIKEDFSKLTTSQIQQAPIIEYSSEIEVGRIKAGKKATCKLWIKNVGVNPLEIRRMYSNDGNITFATPTKIANGKTENIQLTINTLNSSKGNYTREVTIITNDPKRPVVKAKVFWSVY